SSYSETHYDRLFDLVRVEREKVGLVHGLGPCRLEYRVRAPSTDSILGEGITPEDVAFMRERGDDVYAEDERVALYAEGRAGKDGQSKRFQWAFRRGVEVELCGPEGGAAAGNLLTLEEGDERALRGLISAEELFREQPSPSAPLSFDRVALADADVD